MGGFAGAGSARQGLTRQYRCDEGSRGATYPVTRILGQERDIVECEDENDRLSWTFASSDNTACSFKEPVYVAHLPS